MRISDWSSDVCSSDLGQKVDPARGPERGEPVRRQRLDRREVRDEGRVARESLFLTDAGDFQNGLRLLLCPLNPCPRSRPPIDIDATRVLHRDAHSALSVSLEFAGASLCPRPAPQGTTTCGIAPSYLLIPLTSY